MSDRARSPRRASAGQSLVEFSLVVPVIMMFLLGMLEFGLAFDHLITLSYSTREGARTGAALVNGGGPLGCATGQSPAASTVDANVIAAVERVLVSPGSQVDPAMVSEIRIYRATATGTETPGAVNRWVWDPGNGPLVDGERLDFSLAGTPGYPACTRTYVVPAQSIGVSVRYRYRFTTPLGALFDLFGGGSVAGLDIADRTVMAMNPMK